MSALPSQAVGSGCKARSASASVGDFSARRPTGFAGLWATPEQRFVDAQPARHRLRVEQLGVVLALQQQGLADARDVDEQLEVLELPRVGRQPTRSASSDRSLSSSRGLTLNMTDTSGSRLGSRDSLSVLSRLPKVHSWCS